MPLYPRLGQSSHSNTRSKAMFGKLLALMMLTVLLSIQFVMADEEAENQLNTEFAVLNEENLTDYVSTMSQRYYEQVDLLRSYYQLYQQKYDPRGFNVWHLKGFSPKHEALNTENQHVAVMNEEFLAERPERALTTIFAELKEVSINLLLAFRENDPAAFHAANAMVKDHNQQLTVILK